jgi:phosphoglycerate kinase
MPYFRTLDQAEVMNKRVLLRVDLNVPVDRGKVSDGTRIERMAPTLLEIADKGGKVILLSHFGRPKGPDPKDGESGSTRTPVPAQGGQQSGDCGQQVMAG